MTGSCCLATATASSLIKKFLIQYYVLRLRINQQMTLSLRFNDHFPDEPGLAGVYWSKEWWRWWWQLEL